MFSPLAHISLRRVADRPAHLRKFQLERHPQALLSARIAWGDVWTLADGAAADPAYAGIDVAELYWLRPPARDGAQAFLDLAERQAQSGRGPPGATTVLHDFFVPLKGYVAQAALVSPEALPFRPATGIHLTVSRFDSHGAAAENAFRWYDQERIPEMLACGASGAWSFTSAALFRPGRDLAQPHLRIVAAYLDQEPQRFAEALAARPRQQAEEAEAVLFRGLFRAVTPWRWDK